MDSLSAPKRAEAKGKLAYILNRLLWREILATPERYEFAISNYSRQHFYVTVNYKYRLPSGDYMNQQEHLLNTQRNRLGKITQVRYNILFINMSEILRDYPYQNRQE